ncbi:MAG: hypothetical protein LBT40_11245 [Deltaproteobacteria bacterium]|jgi:hypothetical protein|nr:hypothetical protein [Deltaproteobacteria bacterium]
MPSNSLFKIAETFRSTVPPSGEGRVFAYPVPRNLVSGASGAFAGGATQDNTLILVDESNREDGLHGFVATTEGVFSREQGRPSKGVPLDQVKSVLQEGYKLCVNGFPFHVFKKLDGFAVRSVASAVSELVRLPQSCLPGRTPSVPAPWQDPHALPKGHADTEAKVDVEAKAEADAEADILGKLRNILAGTRDVYVVPHIPEHKLKGAVEAYAYGASEVSTLFLVDNSVSGKAGEGILATLDMVFAKDLFAEPSSWELGQDIAKIETIDRRVRLDGKEFANLHLLSPETVRKVAAALECLAGLERHVVGKQSSAYYPASFPASLPAHSSAADDPDLETLLSELTSRVEGVENVFVKQDIPADKLLAAIQSYAPRVLPKDVLLLADNTSFGRWMGGHRGKRGDGQPEKWGEGILATLDTVYAKDLYSRPIFVCLGLEGPSFTARGRKILTDVRPFADLFRLKESSVEAVAIALRHLAEFYRATALTPSPSGEVSQSPFEAPATLPEILQPPVPTESEFSSVLPEPAVIPVPAEPEPSSALPETEMPPVPTEPKFSSVLPDPAVLPVPAEPEPSSALPETEMLPVPTEPEPSSVLPETETLPFPAEPELSSSLPELVALHPSAEPELSSAMPETEMLPAPTEPELSSDLPKPAVPPPSTEPKLSSAMAEKEVKLAPAEPDIPLRLTEIVAPPLWPEPDLSPPTPPESLTARSPEPHAPPLTAATFDDTALRLGAVLYGLDRVRIYPDLDMGKLGAALVSFASAVRAADVIFQVHDSQSPGGSAVMVVTGEGVFALPSRAIGGYAPFPAGSPQVAVADDLIFMGGVPVARLEGMADRERRLIALAVNFVAVTHAASGPHPGTAASFS